jgi:hypothetical protein
LLKPDPNSQIHARSPEKTQLCRDRRGIFADHLIGTAVLEYGPQRYCRRLTRNGKPGASLLTRSPSQLPRPARKSGVLDRCRWPARPQNAPRTMPAALLIGEPGPAVLATLCSQTANHRRAQYGPICGGLGVVESLKRALSWLVVLVVGVAAIHVYWIAV